MRVAAGAIAKKYLKERLGLQVRGRLSQIGDVRVGFKSWDAVEDNPFFCADPEAVDAIAALIDGLRSEGDSIGASALFGSYTPGSTVMTATPCSCVQLTRTDVAAAMAEKAVPGAAAGGAGADPGAYRRPL